MRTARRCCVATRSENFSRAASRSPASTSAFTAAAISESFERTRPTGAEEPGAVLAVVRRACVLIRITGCGPGTFTDSTIYGTIGFFFEGEPPRPANDRPARAAKRARRSLATMTIQVERAHGLEALGIVRSGRVHWNL